MYYPHYMPRNHQVNNQPMLEAVLGGIKKEAAEVELYRELANAAPNPLHRKNILQLLAGKRAQLTKFTNLYSYFTGRQPAYPIDKIPFRGYEDGLQKAYDATITGNKEYQRGFLLAQHPQIQNFFMQAITDEQQFASLLGYLREEMPNHRTDYGPNPFVVNIEEASKENNTFRTALWTGSHLQVTLMSINVGEEIGLEIHPTLDQFLRLEQGQGVVQMGDTKEALEYQKEVFDDYAIVIPAGKWHNLINTGNEPIKLYSIYAPPQHPYGTIHETKAIAMAAEEEHHHE